MPCRATIGDIEVAVEPFETDVETQSVLDAKLFSAGVLPILVVLRNRGTDVYELNPKAIFLLAPDGDHSTATTTTNVARTTGKIQLSPQSRDALGVTSGILAPLSRPQLPWHTAEESAQADNRRLAREYLALGLPHYVPSGETRGLVFFQIPKGTAIALDGYHLRFEKIGARAGAESMQVEIPLVNP